MGDGSVTRNAARKPRPFIHESASNLFSIPFVDVPQPLFEINYSLSDSLKPEMSGLDDTGMNRADRDLVYTFAFRPRPFILALALLATVLDASKVFSERPGIGRPILEFYPWPRIGMLVGKSVPSGFRSGAQTGSRHEVFGEAREDRVV